ncbi:MarR family transcriptional regulator [Variovorax sp. ZS18.2.2]|uniref:MarR family winged helix-turn-helix transcriptional regulator n=1 Tax=Variovorax sp. ZS18.2.2 TaxID=2971255 RepID=UPI00215139F0|nr:MarR family transcriptional regulator [Variovorax sp. ZS18.2.2]MCR6475961.1 MarR family transcriptional regulator [Variovorax sp. ZS18.2.2]
MSTYPMPNLTDFISGSITYASQISYLASFYTNSVYRQVMEKHEISRSDFVVVFCLNKAGEMTAQDICAFTGRPKNSVSRAVNTMLERGYIARRNDPNDARRAVLSITRRGSELYEAALPLFEARQEAMLAPLTAKECATLARLLEKLVLREDAWAVPEAD